MAPAVPFEFVIDLDCSDPGKKRCRIFLPHRSLLGTFENAAIRPTGEWPLTFLCLRHEHLSVRSADSIRRAGPERFPSLPTLLWRVEYECGHENCGKQSTIYVPSQPDANSIKSRLQKTRPAIECGSHFVLWREELIQIFPVTQLPLVR